MNISVLAFPYYLTCGILFNLNILKSNFWIKRFSNKPKTLVIYYSRIKHFLPLVSKVGLLFVLFFSVLLRECFFLPVSISLPWRIFLPRSSWEKNRPGAKNGHGEEKTSLWTEKRVRKGPLFSTRDEITITLRHVSKLDLIGIYSDFICRTLFTMFGLYIHIYAYIRVTFL